MPIPFQTLQEMIDEEMKALKRYRRALGREDQPFFDEITSYIQKHMLACTQADHLLPMEIFLITILLEQQKQITSLKLRIAELHKPSPRKGEETGKDGMGSNLSIAGNP